MTTTSDDLDCLTIDAWTVFQRLLDAEELVDFALRVTIDAGPLIRALNLGSDYAFEVEVARRDLKKIGDRLGALAKFAHDRESLLAPTQLHT